MEDRIARLEEVLRLKDSVGIKALKEELKWYRDRYYANLAREIGKSTQPVNQRELDYKRGFWEGAFWITMLPGRADHDLEEVLKAELDKGVDA